MVMRLDALGVFLGFCLWVCLYSAGVCPGLVLSFLVWVWFYGVSVELLGFGGGSIVQVVLLDIWGNVFLMLPSRIARGHCREYKDIEILNLLINMVIILIYCFAVLMD